MADDAGDGHVICCLPDVVPPAVLLPLGEVLWSDPGPLLCAMVGAALVQSAPWSPLLAFFVVDKASATPPGQTVVSSSLVSNIGDPLIVVTAGSFVLSASCGGTRTTTPPVLKPVTRLLDPRTKWLNLSCTRFWCESASIHCVLGDFIDLSNLKSQGSGISLQESSSESWSLEIRFYKWGLGIGVLKLVSLNWGPKLKVLKFRSWNHCLK